MGLYFTAVDFCFSGGSMQVLTVRQHTVVFQCGSITSICLQLLELTQPQTSEMPSFLFKLVLSHDKTVFCLELSCLMGFNELTACTLRLWGLWIPGSLCSNGLNETVSCTL